jgi:hypothetical protein
LALSRVLNQIEMKEEEKPIGILTPLLLSVRERIELQRRRKERKIQEQTIYAMIFISQNLHLFNDCETKLDYLIKTSEVYQMFFQ